MRISATDGARDQFGSAGSAALLRALEVYEVDRLDFAEAYLVAQAESTGVSEIVSFDRSLDRIESVLRREP